MFCFSSVPTWGINNERSLNWEGCGITMSTWTKKIQLNIKLYRWKDAKTTSNLPLLLLFTVKSVNLCLEMFTICVTKDHCFLIRLHYNRQNKLGSLWPKISRIHKAIYTCVTNDVPHVLSFSSSGGLLFFFFICTP